MIRTVIIDDEPSAVNVLSMLLTKKCGKDVSIIGTSYSPQEGKQLIENLAPDLVFLDIEMPGMSGIDLMRSFPKPNFQVVFVTAYDAYAVEAFRLSAVDYLLKPVEVDDLVKAVEKIKADMALQEMTLHARLEELEKLLRKKNSPADSKIGIGMFDKIVFVPIQDILYCEAQGAYTQLFLQDGRKMLASKALGEFESQLAGHKFMRIHHHFLINLNHVKEFQRQDGGYVIMENDKQLEVSQRKRKEFLDGIGDMLV
jgi:two-component system LytT family response regulator